MNEELKAGMYVYISQDLDRTDKLYSVTPEMAAMKGSRRKIQAVNIDIQGHCVLRIAGYSWSANDVVTKKTLERVAKTKVQEFYYDVDQLDI